MTGPTTYRSLRTIEAMQVEESVDNHGTADDIDPNRASVVAISGWMLANGYTGFKVIQSGNGYGIHLDSDNKDAHLGDYVTLERRASRKDWKVMTDLDMRSWEAQS
jgi:hypothetical protein